MGLVKSFEQKFFFNWSRHLWNFLGVSGFIAFSTGVILFLNSTFIESYKSKKQIFGEDYVSEFMINEEKGIAVPLSYQEWLDSANKKVTLLSSREWAEKNFQPYPISEDGKKLLDSSSFAKYDNYRKKQFKKYREFNVSALVKKRNLQNKKYEDYKKEVDDRNDIKYGQRFVSPFVMGYGLAVVASSSLSSALLSIERNTRKKED